jgi:hypothetical protein
MWFVYIGTAAIGAGLLYFVFENKKSAASSSGKGRDSIARDSACFDSSGEAAWESKRLAEACKNPMPSGQIHASMVAEAEELKKKGALCGTIQNSPTTRSRYLSMLTAHRVTGCVMASVERC